ncbi:uridine kinase family-domain-containing protein [Pavlovales sp. CCMP2436]|nr:uridine kinase family-domain-containing protein [Pavlovales sp. CCMP2436]
MSGSVMRCLLLATIAASASGYSAVSPRSAFRGSRVVAPARAAPVTQCTVFMATKTGVKAFVVGVAADSGCGKSTFMRRLTNIFGGSGALLDIGRETNTLVSDKTTMRQQTLGCTFWSREIAWACMRECVPSGVISGAVRAMLDLSIYLDISDDVKFAWKIQRDMQERGHSLESIKKSIEGRKPDFDAYVAPQRAMADIVIEVLPTQLVDDKEGKFLRVRFIQKAGLDLIKSPFLFDEAKFYGELTQQILKNKDAVGSDNGTGFMQTLCSFKIREAFEKATGKTVEAVSA